ncbi:hypothetical protein DFJ77DRAFT_215563, partial [Powellomyces hirtus]
SLKTNTYKKAYRESNRKKLSHPLLTPHNAQRDIKSQFLPLPTLSHTPRFRLSSKSNHIHITPMKQELSLSPWYEHDDSDPDPPTCRKGTCNGTPTPTLTRTPIRKRKVPAGADACDNHEVKKETEDGKRIRKSNVKVKIEDAGADDADACDIHDVKKEDGKTEKRTSSVKMKREGEKKKESVHVDFKPNPDQEAFLITLVQKYGTSWIRVADEYNKRYRFTADQMRNRWRRHNLKMRKVVDSNNSTNNQDVGDNDNDNASIKGSPGPSN